MVVVDARISEESDRKAVEHLIDTFKVDCNRVTSQPLPASETTADLSNDTSPPASSTGSPESTSSNKYPWGLYPEGEDQVREAAEQY